MATPPGFASCSYELRHASMNRSAFITFGIDAVDTDPNAVCTALVGDFSAPGSLFSVIDSNVTLIATHAALGTDGGEDLVGVSGTPVACTRSANTLPANCATLVHKRTTRGGRRGRGRWYIPWSAQAQMTDEAGKLLPADVTLVQNAVNAWFAAIQVNPGPMVLLHRPSAPGTTRPTTPGPPNVVTSLTVDTLVATQRRRLGR